MNNFYIYVGAMLLSPITPREREENFFKFDLVEKTNKQPKKLQNAEKLKVEPYVLII